MSRDPCRNGANIAANANLVGITHVADPLVLHTASPVFIECVFRTDCRKRASTGLKTIVTTYIRFSTVAHRTRTAIDIPVVRQGIAGF